MRGRRWIFLTAVLVIAIFAWLLRGRIHFDWAALANELRSVSLSYIFAGTAAIYVGYWLRALRWSVLLPASSPASGAELLPAQLIGFTVVALFGRVVDLARPWLIARRLNTPVATQLAIYSIERAFDLAAAAILFSVTLVFAPKDMPHHETFSHAGALALDATLLLAVFALLLRFAGDHLAAFAGRVLRPFSAALAQSASARILDFREGIRSISTAGQFFAALALSLVMWLGIAFSYIASAHAFRASPQLAVLSLSATMLLLATSMGTSLFQLPVIGWFTQIAALAAALHGFFGVPLETATACGVVIYLVTTLGVIPAGLIAARMQGIGLRDAAQSMAAADR